MTDKSKTEEPMTRVAFDAHFEELRRLKKAAKQKDGADGRREYLERARRLVELADRVKETAPGAKLNAAQTSAYAWALYALAKDGGDAAAARRFLKVCEARAKKGWKPDETDKAAIETVRFMLSPAFGLVAAAEAAAKSGRVAESVELYARAFTAAGGLPAKIAFDYLWQAVKLMRSPVVVPMRTVAAAAFALRRTVQAAPWREDDRAKRAYRACFIAVGKRLHDAQKRDGDGGSAIPFNLAKCYVELAENGGFALFEKEDFDRKPVTEETKAGMEAKSGGRVFLKCWPSNVDEAVSAAARCIKRFESGRWKIVPGPAMLDFTARHAGYNDWFGFYHAMWLKAAGRGAEAAENMVRIVKRMRGAAWAWGCYGDLLAEEPEKARACYCRALSCPAGDGEGAEGMARNLHRKLAAALRATGQSAEAAAEERAAAGAAQSAGAGFYKRYAAEADKLLFKDGGLVELCGLFEKPQGRQFGFTRVQTAKGVESVFVPAALARRLPGGVRVKVLAAENEGGGGRSQWIAEDIARADD